jgi:hypothetical protein
MCWRAQGEALVNAAVLFLVLLFDSGANRTAIADSVDVIEINHYLNAAGETLLDQIIFWDFCPCRARYVVRSWRSLKSPSQIPYRAAEKFEVCWRDNRDGCVLRKVRANSVRETWTDYDPETANQEVVDRNCRRELSVPPRSQSK